MKRIARSGGVGRSANLFGWSKKEKAARTKHVSGHATQARGAGYRYATHKSDENFQEWLDRHDFTHAKEGEKGRLAAAFSMGFDRGKKELESKDAAARRKVETKVKGLDRLKRAALDRAGKASSDQARDAERRKADAIDRKIEQQWRDLGHRNPAASARQYRLAEAVLHGHVTGGSAMPKKVAREIVESTPAKLRSEYMRANPCGARKGNGAKTGKGKKRGRRNPGGLEAAAALSEEFHGRPAKQVITVTEHIRKPPRDLTMLGDLVEIVIDTPTGFMATLPFNLSDPKKIVRLACSTDRKQLYFRGGDQEINLATLGMNNGPWKRDLVELGRLHEFPEKPENPKDKERGSIVYRTRKSFNDFKVTDWWHRAGEDSVKQVGSGARPILVYDARNKMLELVGGHYRVERAGIID